MNCTPVALFTYKRLGTLKNTISSLQKNYLASKSDLIIFSDGPKNKEEESEILELREFLRTIDGFNSVLIIESKENKGLAKSIIQGVTEVLKNHNSIIVLEDDLLTTPNFLNYMNSSLNQYHEEQKVFSVSGYSFNLGLYGKLNSQSYFLNRGWSWGWATWKDRWEKVDWEINDYDDFKKNRVAKKKFAQGGSDLNKMLEKQMNGELDSWAIRWFYNQYKFDGLTLYPVRSKVSNEGFGEEATHTSGSDRRYVPMIDSQHSTEFTFPKDITITPTAQQKFQLKMGYLARIRSKLETLLLK